jgi:predicted nucleic acid-binding protein
MTFTGTNWLAAMFFTLEDKLAVRNKIVGDFLRKHNGRFAVSEIVMLEVERVFRHQAGEPNPEELIRLKNDQRFYRDPMNWSLVKREAVELFKRYAHKAGIGTFDTTLLASAKLAGMTRLLTFDEGLKALAVAEGIEIYPPLAGEGKKILAQLKN